MDKQHRILPRKGKKSVSIGYFNFLAMEFENNDNYKQAELYATSWGDVNAFKSGLRTHDCDTTQRLRRFLIVRYNYFSDLSVVMKLSLGRSKLHPIGQSAYNRSFDGCHIRKEDYSGRKDHSQ